MDYVLGHHPVTLCGQQLSGLQHVCAFFDSREGQYQILNPYFQEEVVSIVESAFRDEHPPRGHVDEERMKYSLSPAVVQTFFVR